MLSKAGKLSLRWFLTAIAVLTLIPLEKLCDQFSSLLMLKKCIWMISFLYGFILAIGLRFKYAGFSYQVSLRSVMLGSIFSFGVITIIYSTLQWNLFGLYVCLISLFHYSEFLAISWCNPSTLSLRSFLLNHSPQYNLAAAASWIEFAIEIHFYPEMKRYYIISGIGFTMCILGEILRKSAMITGSTNFDHIVHTQKRAKHKLITHGVYSYCRHPSYVGWFYWSIGTQLLLLNPICIVAYTIISWRFFNERIYHEEEALLRFFKRNYFEYQKRVGVGLPWIKGFRVDI